MQEEIQKRPFTVVYDNGERKEISAVDVTHVYVRVLSMLLALKKSYRIEIIIDEAKGIIYGDFEWDLAFGVKDKAYVTGTPFVYNKEDIEYMVLAYARSMGSSETFAKDWFAKKARELQIN
jgi:hypothetical protein